MYGAILGDIIGSPFEFDRGDKTKNFDLFSEGCGFTDDSVMTIAVGEALLAVGPEAAVKKIEDAVASNMQDWGKRYPHAGYGGSFRHWLKENNPKPYGSYGNGSAMRVSAVGWLYDSMERTREVARATANVTHNHPEGIKGAESTASAIYMARNGSSKEEIKTYIEREFHYDLSRTLDNIRTYYHHVESCQETVPEAIIAFLESKDFEDAIRNAVSLGGDTDTLGAITGSIAELQAQHDRLQKERDQLQERMNHLEEQREHLQMQTDQAFRSADEIEKIYDEIWNHANTIHLYSSLAEEESKSITMKEKQKEIIRTTEEILNIIYKYKGNV